ncbi:MAG TPA: BatD family protein [Gammaproteobacteria bacterium]|nr:BatD family protein [Gammaproteobacteria bacterium]HPI94818.1 BatD family protein [Gammaproteobacteria bacterium]HPQ86411.1 BatD family protein [Gammaproteobacteria bacterium]
MKNLLLIGLILISFNSFAEVTASVDRSRIIIGETLTLTISVDENSNEEPDLTELEDVFTVLGTSKSSSTQIINNSYSTQTSWQISLMPNGVGENTIPPIKVGSQQTKPIQISVTKSDPNAKANGDVFIEAETDKTKAFVKEQIILTVRLFYGIALSEGSLSDPVASDTIITQLDKGANYRTVRDGRSYEVVERRYAMFAEKSGKLELNPIIFNGRDNSSRRSFSMFATGKPVRAVSKPVEIEIKPIPQTSIGKDWLPASNVQISQEWSSQPYKVGEPITRTITLYVEGLNETQIPEIDLGEIDGIRVYPEQPLSQTEKEAENLKSWKQVKLAMIPTQSGKIRIPEFQLEWFNTKTGQVEFAKLPPVTLDVEAGDFALEKPPIGNLFETKSPKSVSNVSESHVDANANKAPSSEVKVIEKDSWLWKSIALISVLLWLVTLAILLSSRKKKRVSDSSDKAKRSINKQDIISSINNKDLSGLQESLIRWWNQQHPENQVNNLSGIKPLVAEEMQSLIENLELLLYSPSTQLTEFDTGSWLKQVKGKGLNIQTVNQINPKNELPELYS